MSGMIRTRKRRALVAMFAALALVLGGSLGLVARGQAQATGTSQAQTEQDTPYKSSIQVPNDDRDEDEDSEDSDSDERAGKEADERDEATSPKEQAEAARYQKLARITADQARSAALAAVPGTATSVELENEDGNLVYGVSVKTSAGERDVKVDAGNGKVLHIEKDD